MGEIAGYTVTDYLLWHASQERRYARVPASTWNALISHIRDHIEASRLARSADDRWLYCYAVPLYQYVVDANDQCTFRRSATRLADLLAKHGDRAEFVTRRAGEFRPGVRAGALAA